MTTSPAVSVGQKFGLWTAVERTETRRSGKKGYDAVWRCRCDCGSTRDVLVNSLRRGKSVSCGCVQREDLTGSRFGRWLVVARFTPKPHEAGDRKTERSFRWLCRCDCGVERVVRARLLREGTSASCGCGKLKRRGLTATRAYYVWYDMLARCYKETNRSFRRYGGRGITVCERWHEFENFLADMGQPPPNLSIDRENNDGNYEPGNCRWATRSQQQQNRHDNRPNRKGSRVSSSSEIQGP